LLTTTEPETIALMLDESADRIIGQPGTNVLDAMRDAFQTAGADDTIIGDTYYTLREYLPPHVDLLAPWSDSETADRVVEKLRNCARTTRRGGPARIDDHPPTPASERDLAVVDPAGGRRRGHKHERSPSQSKRRPGSRDAELRMVIGQAKSSLVRMRRGKHPNPQKILDAELRLEEAQRELEGIEERADDARAVDDELRRNGYQRDAAGSLSGL